MIKKQKGFSVTEMLVILLVVGLIGAVGWLVYDRQKNNIVSQQGSQNGAKQQPIEKKDTLETYTIENEELVFDYNPNISTVKKMSAAKIESTGLYVVKTEVITGSVRLSIITGISNIGGGPACDSDSRGSCKVVDTRASTYLGEPITYRLIEAKQVENCGYAGASPCDKAPLVTSYLLDTSTSNEFFGPCCGTISSEAKNVGKKASVPGSVLVDIAPSEGISNADLFQNSNILETIKIIETLRYKQI